LRGKMAMVGTDCHDMSLTGHAVGIIHHSHFSFFDLLSLF
jgi:hypothetical protein